MANTRDMKIVNPNDYKIFKDFNMVQKGDFIIDYDGEVMATVINRDDSTLICKNLDTGKNFDVTEDGARHLGYRYKRQNPTKISKISEEIERQIAECLRLAGVK